CCARKFKAPPPQDMPKGSPFGPNLRALVIDLRFTQGIAFERLATLLSDLLGLDISEGALVNILDAAKDAFAKATAAIRAKLLDGAILQSDETGLRPPLSWRGRARRRKGRCRHGGKPTATSSAC